MSQLPQPLDERLHRRLVGEQLEWLRFVERFDEATAARILADRLDDDRAAARARVRLPAPWPSMPANVGRMMRRDSELVRFDRVAAMITDGDRLLDIGCGHGVVAAAIAARHTLSAYLGVDLSAANVASATEMADSNDLSHVLRFEEADATRLDPRRIESLAPDVALFLEVLEHVTDPVAALTSVADALPDDTMIIFSVPLLGRIEACWGHRSVFGASAIAGLVSAAGLTLQHVEEVQNTWALAAATRSAAPHPRLPLLEREASPAAAPAPIHHVRLDRVAIDATRSELQTSPHRLVIEVAGSDEAACITFPAAGATLVRVDLDPGDGNAFAELAIETLSASGDPVTRWRTSSTSLPARRRTVVLRPGWPDEVFVRQDGSGSDPVTHAAIRARARPGRTATLTLWRIGYGTGPAPEPATTLGAATHGAGSTLRRIIRRVTDRPAGVTRIESAKELAVSARARLVSRARRLRAALRRR